MENQYKFEQQYCTSIKYCKILNSISLFGTNLRLSINESIWATGCMLMIACVLSDLIWLPLIGGGRKSWYIIIIFIAENVLLEANKSLVGQKS